ncbi:hypothetical protein ACN38_g9284 [Penicillium nordicum]|uniref:Aminoglycoside phosphotransferase domain-containing protein n=1 Tax=Penicillium nordicum TaxID=229535 RepID=A0A0M8NVW9_9EURO|nr:hypothetical protein ACN38_g9284 [Penicillium nordicum]
MRGSFNICILVDFYVPGQNKQLIIRFPLPYRIGDICYPGNADEKILCEAGTYAWLQTNCPDVPIPYLYGFGLRSGKTFTALDNRPFLPRLLEKFRRRILEWFGYTSPSRYIPLPNVSSLNTGYLLIEYIKPCQGKMLSKSWEEGRHDPKLWTNLFHGLSRTLLALARTPLPKIGSFILDEGGYLQLENRPLTLQIQQLENEQIPVDIPRDRTYTSVDSYIHDILSFHETRLATNQTLYKISGTACIRHQH